MIYLDIPTVPQLTYYRYPNFSLTFCPIHFNPFMFLGKESLIPPHRSGKPSKLASRQGFAPGQAGLAAGEEDQPPPGLQAQPPQRTHCSHAGSLRWLLYESICLLGGALVVVRLAGDRFWGQVQPSNSSTCAGLIFSRLLDQDNWFNETHVWQTIKYPRTGCSSSEPYNQPMLHYGTGLLGCQPVQPALS